MKHVLVVGMGMSGKAAAEALRNAGEAVDTYDKKENPEFPAVRGEDGRAVYDQLVVSPGVPLDLPFIEEAKAAGSEIIGELELAYRMGSGTYFAITGTNGKTTTTTLTGEIFKASGRPTEVVGNIGVSVISKSVGCAADTCLVTECSSFQLDTTVDFRPHIAAVLNLSPDHLDRHGTAENYYQAKLKIAKNQRPEDFFVYNADDAETHAHVKTLATQAQLVPFSRKKELPYGVFVRDGVIVCRTMPCAGSANDPGFDEFCEVPVCRADEVYIPGGHNLENALAATTVAFFAGISPEVIAETLRTFKGVEHRLEYAGKIGAIRFVNDSKGTNPDAAIKALEATNGDIYLIAGGYDKHSSYDEFIDAFGGKVRGLYLLGQTAEDIRKAAEAKGFTACVMCRDMKECVERAYADAKVAGKPATVLLSPACASWGMYNHFEERGEDFKDRAKELGATL